MLREGKKVMTQPNDSTVFPPSILSTASTCFYTSVCFVVGCGEWREANGEWGRIYRNQRLLFMSFEFGKR